MADKTAKSAQPCAEKELPGSVNNSPAFRASKKANARPLGTWKLRSSRSKVADTSQGFLPLMPGQPYSLFQQRNTKATSVGTSENPQAGTTSPKEDAGTANKGAPFKFTFLPLLSPPADENATGINTSTPSHTSEGSGTPKIGADDRETAKKVNKD